MSVPDANMQREKSSDGSQDLEAKSCYLWSRNSELSTFRNLGRPGGVKEVVGRSVGFRGFVAK